MARIITPVDAAERLEDSTALHLDVYQLQIGRARLKAFFNLHQTGTVADVLIAFVH